MPSRILLSALVLFVPISAARAQSAAGFNARRQAMALHAETTQPRWATPLVSTTPLLDQSVRTDFQHGTRAAHARLWNLDAGKGLKVVVAPRLELDFNAAPYFIHLPRHQGDGFGDVSFAAKYRLFARPERHGSWVLTAFLQATYPTGAYSNGAKNATVIPTLAGGKGFGPFTVESTVGGTLPTAGTRTAGRSIGWNTAGLLHAAPHLWFELESNATFYRGGANGGKVQNYVTPGVLARFRNPTLSGVTVAAGMQFATTHTHALDHNLLLSVRAHF